LKLTVLINQSSLKNKINITNDAEVTGLAYDSRKVNDGNIFFAVKGFNFDGNIFINDAIEKGAKIIFSEDRNNEMINGASIYKINEIRKIMAELSDIYFDHPSQKLKLIGITGTNGKTTTSFLIKSFLEEAGYKVGLMGTIDYLIGDKKITSSLTTPESVEINQMLSQMVQEKTDYCIMEVSSIALKMERVYKLNFSAAVFTNLTSEHLDFHSTMEEYLSAKKILFDDLNEKSYAISNKDDEYGESILQDTNAKKIYYSIHNESDFKAENEKLSLQETEFEINYNGVKSKLRSNLPGRFNIYNILAATTTVNCFGIEMESINYALSKFKEVSGRFNKVALPNGAIAVVDYSHTSDSLKNVIEAAREILNSTNPGSKLITIFGCGGNRDKTKRPVMGNYATSLSDYTIITSDNPRFEKPEEIIDDILKGLKKDSSYEVIVNREDAIRKGIELSSGGDIILICGKGHETYQEVKGVKSHFDDKEIVAKYSNMTAKE
jgi:UDP-N-acetylmuramoyl-L-alanyl-D-glutamate--2,6-diaminopimelate ligase